MKKNMILISHGEMAREVYRSAKMIVGDVIKAEVVCMTECDGLAGTIDKLRQAIDVCEKNKNILIIADLKGGTPCNVATMCSAENQRIKIISGLNLGLVLEAAMIQSDFSDELIANIVETGRTSIAKIELEEDE